MLMGNKTRISVRLSSRQMLLLDELSTMTDTSVSVIVRAFVDKSLESIVDEHGNLDGSIGNARNNG